MEEEFIIGYTQSDSDSAQKCRYEPDVSSSESRAVFHEDCNRFNNVYFLFQLQNLIEIVSAVIISKYSCIKPHEINFR